MNTTTNDTTTSNAVPLLVSLKEAARLLGLGLTTIKKLVAEKQLRAVKVYRRTLIPRQAIEQFTRHDHTDCA